MMPGLHVPRAVMIGAAVVVAIGVGILYFTLDPSSNYFPRCMFHEITGLQCPGCGSQRALHSLLRGDLAAAWHYNALFILEIPLLLLLVAAWYLRSRIPALHRVLNSQTVILTVLAIIILWTIFRNIYNL